MMGLPNTGNDYADAITLGTGLMRGDKESLKLGYTWENALIACVNQYPDLTQDERLKVAVFLRGFGLGLKGERDSDVQRILVQGIEQGEGEAASGRTNPG